jgi:hypothetical protein
MHSIATSTSNDGGRCVQAKLRAGLRRLDGPAVVGVMTDGPAVMAQQSWA